MKKINLGILRQGLKYVIEREAPEQFGEERFYVVVNSNIAAHLYDVNGFKPDSSDKILGGKEPYHIGMLFDEDIYCDPVLPWDLKVEIRENLCDNTKGKLITINFLCAVECEDGHEDAIFEKIEKYLDFFGEDDECEEEETDEEDENLKCTEDEIDERLAAFDRICGNTCGCEKNNAPVLDRLAKMLFERSSEILDGVKDASTFEDRAEITARLDEVNKCLHMVQSLQEE